MKPQEKLEISKEVFEMITAKLQVFGLSFNKDNFHFGLEMFLEGVKFIPNKTTTDSKKNTESG